MKFTLTTLARLALMITAPAFAGTTELLDVEKDQLKIGFIKLTDCAPLVIAKEKGFFEDEGLIVEVEAQANWKVLLDRVITGELDGAHMLAGQPIGATVGFGIKAEVITPISLDYNGNAITVSNAVWEKMKPAIPKDADGKPVHPIKADSFKPIVMEAKATGKPLQFGMVFPVSTHNYELRYWLAAGGINPGFYFDPKSGEENIPGVLNGDLVISVTPPPQMPSTLEAGTIVGYCVGEPWNQQAVFKKIGVPVVTDHEIWAYNPEKVFGITKAFAEKNPNTTLALTKAIIRACAWLDASPENRKEAVKILSRPNYVGADEAVIANSMTGTFEYEPGDKRAAPDFNVFFKHDATYPWASDCVWYLTQMVRWGQVKEQKPDAWYAETAKSVYRADIYEQAAKLLIKEGFFTDKDFPLGTDGFREPSSEFIDGKTYDGHKPNDYLKAFEIGLK
ncbi:CmpA/NrtA family ABC transporter substrate-binding protein [Prosthecobacter sp.]|uniref:CmpA/NrtA family ABC transporter substrate-binding protein n=1 Tax=Prosthecobacter sp. TaxID=1965333 RepID=UPI00248763BF|nr:CmpA/NrtA family ABC transporter substrate-binding protein [Prosthecobacter sp.]MDI1315240.1 CmpA/NrtA family ABC transporter substrate-binding protein [Prosthecobacter sp.]